MISKTWVAAGGIAAALISMSGLSHADTAEPSEQALSSAVTHYLSDHGDLCVGKFSWPRVVTAADLLAGTNDAVQLPVLERLGLVESVDLPASGAASAESGRRYSLTETGRRYYLKKKRITVGAHDLLVEHDEDLCVARLSLDKVVKWSPPEQAHGHLETVVRYTYHVRAANWMSDPQARRVFPVVDRVIRHEGNLLMSVTVRLQDGRWQPVLPTL